MRLTTTASCPICSSTMEFSWETAEIPFFGEAMLISGLCSCGFRHSDTLLLCQKEPARYTLEVTEIADLDARIIRSTSGTIRVPELGITVEPGEASESYISNVEGVLARITEIVAFATRAARAAGDMEKASRGEEILENIRLALRGEFKLTITIEDPLGNSAIASEKAVCAPLKDEEIADLSCGMVILDTKRC